MFTSATHLLHLSVGPGQRHCRRKFRPPLSDSGASVKRLCLLGMAMAGLLTAGISTAATAKTPTKGSKRGKSKPDPKPKPVTPKLSCKLTLVTQPPADDTTILPGGDGSQY